MINGFLHSNMTQVFSKSRVFTRFIFLLLLICGFTQDSRAQNKVIINGAVVDAETGKAIYAVNVTVRGSKIGTATDSLGQFKFELPKGSFVVAFSHIAYKKVIKGVIVDRQASITLRVQMTPSSVELPEVTVTGKKPFAEQRALFSLTGTEFERIGDSNMDRAMHYLLPNIIYTWDVRMRYPSRDFTLYVNGEWKESIYMTDIDPFSVRRVLVWDGEWSPIGLPLRRGKYVVSIETK